MYTSREGHARHGCPLPHCASQCPISPSFPSEMGNLGDSMTDLSRKKIAWVGLLLCLVLVFVFFPCKWNHTDCGAKSSKMR